MAMAKSVHTGVAGLLLVSLFSITGCAAPYDTVAMQPDFEIHTQTGLAAVSVREAPPGMADDEFTHMVALGMNRAQPGSVVQVATAQVADPNRRIVWHVEPEATRGVQRVTVNSFGGQGPSAYEQDVITNDATQGEIVATVEGMTRRLAADENRNLAANSRVTASPAAS
jgi:hypothetical protein